MPIRRWVDIRQYLWDHRPRIPKHDGVAAACLLGAVILFTLQLLGIRQSVLESNEVRKPPVTFAYPMEPEQSVYHPGDLATFRYVRNAEVGHIVIYQLDSLENMETGETYPAAMIVRIIGEPGQDELIMVRKLPDYMRPGRYRLEGLVAAQTGSRTAPAPYYSAVFEVKKP